MGKTAEITEEFLNNGGSGLGYDETNLPKIRDIEIVLNYNVRVWEYNGMTENEWYGVNEEEKNGRI